MNTVSDKILGLNENINKIKGPHGNNQIDLTKAKFYDSIDSLIGDNIHEIFKNTINNAYIFFENNGNKNIDKFRNISFEDIEELRLFGRQELHNFIKNIKENNEEFNYLSDSIFSIFYALDNLDYFKEREFTDEELGKNEFLHLLSHFKINEIDYAINFINYAKFDLGITELDAVYMMTLIGFVVKEKIEKKEHFDLVLSLNNDDMGYIIENGFNSYLEKKEINSWN